MLAMFSDLPIDLEDVRNFENLLRSCDKEYNGTRPSISPVEYDTHYDPDLVGGMNKTKLKICYSYTMVTRDLSRKTIRSPRERCGFP